jgi:hypothetical protein
MLLDSNSIDMIAESISVSLLKAEEQYQREQNQNFTVLNVTPSGIRLFISFANPETISRN